MIMLGNIDSNFFMYFAKAQVDCFLNLALLGQMLQEGYRNISIFCKKIWYSSHLLIFTRNCSVER
jgi:hypothetical protein